MSAAAVRQSQSPAPSNPCGPHRHSPILRAQPGVTKTRVKSRVSTEFRRHGIPRNFLTSEVISAQFRRNSAKFRGIPRNFARIEPEITSVFRGMPKCHFRGHPSQKAKPLRPPGIK
jgi:hypothetical protein